MTEADDTTVFFGRVHPERANVNIRLPLIHVGFSREGLLKASVQVDLSQFTARVSGALDEDLFTERNGIGSVAQLFVDVLGLTNGCGYTVEIVGCNRNGGTTIFGCDVPALAGDPPQAPADFQGIASLLLADGEGRLFPLRRALGDFRRAILEPDDTPFHCYRSVEALTYYFGKNPRQGRPKMCAALRIDNNWIRRELEIPAGEIRHGKLVTMTGDDRVRALVGARSVLVRFIEFVSLGLDGLPEDGFPVIPRVK